MKKIGIYCIKNLIDEKVYIGSSIDIKGRKSCHFSELKYNRHSNQHLQSAYNKDGIESFEFFILEECEKEEDLLELEDSYMEKLKSLNMKYGYNLKTAERHLLSEETKQKISKSRKGSKLSDETKKKIGEASKGNTHNLGRKLSKEHKKKISESLTGQTRENALGHPCSEETKQKLREASTGRKLSKEVIEKMVESRRGYKHSEETKKKIGEASRGNNYGKGYKHTGEAKRKIGEASKNRKREKRSEETKKKISKGNKGKTVSLESKGRMSKAQKLRWAKIKAEKRNNRN